MSKKCFILGIGGGGCNVLEHIAEFDKEAFLIAINNEIATLNLLDSSISHKIHIDKNQEELKKYLENSYNEENILDENIKNTLYKLTKDCKEIAIIVTAGGVTGSAIAPATAKYLKSLSKKVAVVATLPFKFEGKMREKNAKETIEKLKRICDYVEVVDNNDVLKYLKGNESIEEGFEMISKMIYEAVFKVCKKHMRAYARWIEEGEYAFRDETILQFGESFDLLANIILLNPGSAVPKSKKISTTF